MLLFCIFCKLCTLLGKKRDTRESWKLKSNSVEWWNVNEKNKRIPLKVACGSRFFRSVGKQKRICIPLGISLKCKRKSLWGIREYVLKHNYSSRIYFLLQNDEWQQFNEFQSIVLSFISHMKKLPCNWLSENWTNRVDK